MPCPVADGCNDTPAAESTRKESPVVACAALYTAATTVGEPRANSSAIATCAGATDADARHRGAISSQHAARRRSRSWRSDSPGANISGDPSGPMSRPLADTLPLVVRYYVPMAVDGRQGTSTGSRAGNAPAREHSGMNRMMQSGLCRRHVCDGQVPSQSSMIPRSRRALGWTGVRSVNTWSRSGYPGAQMRRRPHRGPWPRSRTRRHESRLRLHSRYRDAAALQCRSRGCPSL